MCALIVAGWVSNYSINANKISNLEDAMKTIGIALDKDFVHRSEHIEVQRRVDKLEVELVPRSEHLLRETELNKRLDIMQDQLKGIQEDINQVKNDVKRR